MSSASSSFTVAPSSSHSYEHVEAPPSRADNSSPDGSSSSDSLAPSAPYDSVADYTRVMQLYHRGLIREAKWVAERSDKVAAKHNKRFEKGQAAAATKAAEETPTPNVSSKTF